MPYIATDLDAFDDADAVAGATGLLAPLVLGGLARTWRWCWRNKTDRVTAEQLAGFFCSPLPGLPAALVAFGFLEAGETYRVRGANRYLHITSVRSKAGQLRASGAQRDSRGRLRKSSTGPAHAGDATSTPPAHHQQRTSPSATSDERRATSDEEALRAPPAPPKVRKDPAQKKPPAAPARPGWQALIGRLTDAYQRQWGAKYDFRGDSAKALAAMLDRGNAADVVEAAWARALGSSEFPKVRTLPELDKNLNHFLGAAQGLQRAAGGIMTHTTGLETPEEVAAAAKRQEDWLNGG